MALLSEKPDVRMQAAEIAELLGTELQNCADASFSVAGFSTDTRTIAPGNCFIALKGENFNGNAYAKQAAEKDAVLCVLSEKPQEDPGVPYLLVPDTVTAYGQIAHRYLLKCKQNGLRVIGVTGSSGKTTVKDMTAHVLAAKYRTFATSGNHNNHIGVPYTILHMPEDTEAAVIEMGMNHAGEIHYLSDIAEPDFAIITNIGTAHIGNLGSQENIMKAKLEILDGMKDGGRNGVLIVSADDRMLYAARETISARTAMRFSTVCGGDAQLSAENIDESADFTRFTIRSADGAEAEAVLLMTGIHNVTDALLAVQAGLQIGMTLQECAEALSSFVPGAMRSERVKIGNVTIIRDYYNANPEAMAAALQSLGTIAGDAQKWAVLGNMNELGEYAAARHSALGTLCREYADRAFFCGENYKDFAEGFGSGETAFAEQDALIEALRGVLDGYAGEPVCVLIKGSRGMHMERVNDMLEERFKAGL
ncbi:MAG: UDP-N-acetylmuramoyl-tripeptide--D-alanyl-D-alanine ligase [Oscillospiraceae bacterium]|nr:UDP-N-acetylmuramoyl-tripeptide--D-alanyl-D-alanine ligase [Oscillospiraceae bacterium]